MDSIRDLVKHLKELDVLEDNITRIPQKKVSLVESTVIMPAYIQSVIEASIGFYASVHRWHLITSNRDEHEILDTLYNNIQGNIDTLAERLIVEYGIMSETSDQSISFAKFNNRISVISSYRDLLTSFEATVTDDSVKDAILHILNDIKDMEYQLENLN